MSEEKTEKVFERGEYNAPEVSRLLVFGPETTLFYPLPEAGSLKIGRSPDVEVNLADPAVSRVHAVLRCGPRVIDRGPEGIGAGAGLYLLDYGSSNGTRLRGTRIDPDKEYAFEPGDLIDIGSTTLIVQRGATIDRPRRVFPHGYFELRLEDECTRASTSGGRFAVLRLRVRGQAPQPAIEEILTTLLKPRDFIALYAPLEYDVLLADSGPIAADQILAGIRAGFGKIGVELHVGVACYPRDAQQPGELIARAGAGVRGDAIPLPIGMPPNLVIADPVMRKLYQLVDRIAASDISVLILGETGVGKEVLAKTVHRLSKRREKPFLPLNCGAFTEDLLETELFGHEKGAFTGALREKRGLLETAQGGTVLLDEVGEMPLATQVKLLRVIEERQIRRVGSVEAIPIDVRLVAATNRDLEKGIRSGIFREDLYYRLNGISLLVPPLRARTEEISLLVRDFVVAALDRDGITGAAPRFTAEAERILREYSWPGNVRELKNVIERAVVLSGGGVIGIEHLPMEKLSSSVIFTPEAPKSAWDADARNQRDPRGPQARQGPQDPQDLLSTAVGEIPHTSEEVATLSAEVGDLERKRILAVLEQCVGNQTRAAKVLGISRKALLRRLDLYNIRRPRKGSGET